MISFLPLAHMLERACENAMFYTGGSVGYYSGDIKQLTNDLKALKPTIVSGSSNMKVDSKFIQKCSNSS